VDEPQGSSTFFLVSAHWRVSWPFKLLQPRAMPTPSTGQRCWAINLDPAIARVYQRDRHNSEAASTGSQGNSTRLIETLNLPSRVALKTLPSARQITSESSAFTMRLQSMRRNLRCCQRSQVKHLAALRIGPCLGIRIWIRLSQSSPVLCFREVFT
jgi:hypothetical protein